MTTTELVNSVAAILSFLTLLVVFFTLLEMKAQRNKQYKPIIIFEQAEYTLKTKEFKAEDSPVRTNSTIITSHNGMQLKFKNIGVYPARNVIILVNKRNIQKLKKEFPSIDFSFLQEYFPGFYLISDSPKSKHLFNAQIDSLIPYLPGDAKETELYTLSAIYTIMLERILIHNDYANEAEKVNIEVDINFTDNFGKRYFEKLSVYIDVTSLSLSTNGEGCANFKLTMMKREMSKKHLEKLVPF